MDKTWKMAKAGLVVIALGVPAQAGDEPRPLTTAESSKLEEMYRKHLPIPFGGGPAVLDDEIPEIAWAAPAYTPEIASQLHDRLDPVLAEVVGKKTAYRRDYVTWKADDLQLQRDPVNEAHARWLFPELKEKELEQALEALHQVQVATTLLAHNQGAVTIIHLMPENAVRMASWHESLKPMTSAKFLWLALAHADLAYNVHNDKQQAVLAAKSREEFEIRLALQRGAILWQTEKVARKIGCADLLPLLVDYHRHLPDQGSDARIRLIRQQVMRCQDELARLGLQFLRQLEKSQGKLDLDQICANPPTSLAALENPERYLQAQRSEQPALADLLERVAATLPAGGKIAQQPVSADMMRQVAALFEQSARAERVLAGWQEARSLIWCHPAEPTRQLAVSITRFASPKDARSYFGFAVDLQRKRDELMTAACASTMRVEQSRSNALRWQEIDEGVCCEKMLRMLATKQVLPSKVILIRAGAAIIEFNAHGTELSEEWAQQVCRELGVRPTNR